MKYNGVVNLLWLFTDFQRGYDSFMSEILYEVLTKVVYQGKKLRQIKVRLNKPYSRVSIDKYFNLKFSTEYVNTKL